MEMLGRRTARNACRHACVHAMRANPAAKTGIGFMERMASLAWAVTESDRGAARAPA